MKLEITILLLLLLSVPANGQDGGGAVPSALAGGTSTGDVAGENDAAPVDTGMVYLLNIVDRDGERLPEVEIKEVVIVSTPRTGKKGSNGFEAWYAEQTRMIYNIKKVYPYSQIIKERMSLVNDTLVKLRTDRERRAYIKEFEKSIFAEFEGDVRKMTITQGEILLKLIDRETKNTSYEIIKEYRGGFTAAFWQGVARIFGTNLKATYDPFGEDAVMEIIVRDIEGGWL